MMSAYCLSIESATVTHARQGQQSASKGVELNPIQGKCDINDNHDHNFKGGEQEEPHMLITNLFTYFFLNLRLLSFCSPKDFNVAMNVLKMLCKHEMKNMNNKRKAEVNWKVLPLLLKSLCG